MAAVLLDGAYGQHGDLRLRLLEVPPSIVHG
jgi:hypothetical protein